MYVYDLTVSVRTPGAVQLGTWVKDAYEVTVVLSSRAVVSPEGSAGDKGLLHWPVWLLVGFCSTQAVGLRAQVAHWLLAGGLPQFLSLAASP